MAYQPIENYGIIGDLQTVALVNVNGSLDWLCFPHFDSPSVFAAILDDQKGGHFSIAPEPDGINHKQFYWPETNVLVTRFLSPDGVGEVTDFMAVDEPQEYHGHHQVIRRVKVARGSMTFRLTCTPAFNYARDPHTTELQAEGAIFRSPNLSLGLSASIPLQQTEHGVTAEWTLHEDQIATFVLHELSPDQSSLVSLTDTQADELFQRTVNYWRAWLSQCTYTGRWREMVYRSALVLKLLTFEPTGAIVAAPTTSLPESLGGERNWDYRYTWIRDAAFTLYGLLRIGFTDEAAHFMQWLEARCFDPKPTGPLQPLYRIDGNDSLHEETLDHLDGYRGSKPVRIGNGAATQLQLDIYGELLDAVYLFNKYGAPISYELWRHLRGILDWVCDNWHVKDEGIWEVRSGRQHFVYSKLMCWVALDRGVRLADKRSFPADRAKWLNARNAVYEDIMANGWSEELQAFVQYYGSDTLDASALIMPLVFFLSPTDPRMLKTLDRISQPLREGGLVSNSLVYRYDTREPNDGLTGVEGAFSMCSFWLIEAMTRAGRFDQPRLDQARLMFEEMLTYANHLGLYAEEIGPSGEALGNFPQAFTHLALISAAFNLDRALGSDG